jgi:hypothetical protein
LCIYLIFVQANFSLNNSIAWFPAVQNLNVLDFSCP